MFYNFSFRTFGNMRGKNLTLRNYLTLLHSRMGWPNLLHFRADLDDSRDADNNWQNRRDLLARLRLCARHGHLQGTTALHRMGKTCVQSKQSAIFVQVQRLQKSGGMYEIVQRVKRNSQRLHILFQILLFWGQLQRKRDCKQRLVLLYRADDQ